MIRVIHVLNTNSYSGAENIAIKIIKKIQEDSNFEITYVAIEGPIVEILKENNLSYYLVEKINFMTLKSAVKALQPDIIHCHDFTASILASLVTKKIPIISHIHQNPAWIRTVNLKSICYLFTIPRYSKVISVSKSFFVEYIYSSYIKNQKVMHNIVDVQEISKNKDDSVPKNIDVIYVGRLANEKNPLKCLEIFKTLVKYNSKYQFALVGNGPLYEKCNEYIEENNLTNNVKLYGFQKNVYTYINRSKIAINTSDWEGFGLSVVECLSLGLPVVCSNVGGLTGIINDHCGLLCNDIDEYIHEITKLLQDEKYYSKKSESAICRAYELENSVEYIKAMKEIYYDLANSDIRKGG